MGGTKKVLVLGASGLIGRFVTDDLRARGFHAVGVARRFPSSQPTSAGDLEMPLLAMDSSALARLIGARGIDVVVNCVGHARSATRKRTR
jgi:nucleoside-diphosphate-sugar epimerase